MDWAIGMSAHRMINATTGIFKNDLIAPLALVIKPLLVLLDYRQLLIVWPFY
jgi:hypothetical protein